MSKDEDPQTAEVMSASTMEFRVEDVQHRWHIQAWIGFEQGVPVITELRLRPAGGKTLKAAHGSQGPRKNYKHDPSRPIPPGGVTAKILRSISLQRLYEAIENAPEGQVTPSLDGLSGDTDFLALRRPGRRGRNDAFYAMWAGRYVEKCARTRSPYPELAAEHPGFSERMVRDFVYAARKRGLLLGGSRGRAGGSLSPEAERLLRAMEGEAPEEDREEED